MLQVVDDVRQLFKSLSPKEKWKNYFTDVLQCIAMSYEFETWTKIGGSSTELMTMPL
jgi:hypothetical protein